jgi:hypothetical protein
MEVVKMRKLVFLLPVVLATLVVFAGTTDCKPYDLLQLGDAASETAHSVSGFGDPEPTTHGGSWGNIAAELDPSDKLAKVVWGASEPDHFWDRGAEFTMTVPEKCGICRIIANKLSLRVLDGIANDDFIVLWKDNSQWKLLDVYESDPATNEYWLTKEVSLASIPERMRKSGQKLTFRVVSTGNAWELKSTYGQVALDWVKLGN